MIPNYLACLTVTECLYHRWSQIHVCHVCHFSLPCIEIELATRRVPLLKHDLHTISDYLSFFRFIVVFIFPNVFCVHGVLCHCLSLCKDCEMQNTNKSAVPLHLSTMLNNLSCSYLFLLTYRTVNKLSRVNLYSCSYAWKQ